MNTNMRRSSTQIPSQIPRRSSSIDHSSHQFSSSQPLSNQTNIPVTGRASSIGRVSSIGRPSINAKSNGEKVLNAQDIASSIAILLEDLNYTPATTAKQLLVPSTATFYTIFEFLLKSLGINDVWSQQLLLRNNLNPSTNSTLSQPNANSNVNINSNLNNANAANQQNPIAQNKAKVELVIYHLQMFKYPNIPKQNMLQTMTTPKNWIQMLLILQFFAHNCYFLMTFDVSKIITPFDGTHETQILHDYLKKANEHCTKCHKLNQQYSETEDPVYHKLKQDALTRYANEYKGNEILNKFKREYEGCVKQNEYLTSQENEDQMLANEEEQLKKELLEFEELFNEILIENKETKESIKVNKDDILKANEKLKLCEIEFNFKENEYEKQRATCKDLDKIARKHAQRFQELEDLQTNYNDIESKCDDYQKKLMIKTQEVKKIIECVEDVLDKIKSSSSLKLDGLPEVSLTDFHNRNDIIRQYKESIYKMREMYNAELCKLPDQYLKLKEEKQQINNKLELTKASNLQLDNDIKAIDNTTRAMQNEYKNALNELKIVIEANENKLTEIQHQLKTFNDEIIKLNKQKSEACAEKEKVEIDLKMQINESKAKFEEKKENAIKEANQIKLSNIEQTRKWIKENDELANDIQKYLNKFL